MTHKVEGNTEFSGLEVLDVHFFKAEGFSCSLGVLYGGLGMGSKNIKIKFRAVIFFQFWFIKPWIRIRIRNKKKCWIRIRIKSMRIRNPASD
jgi:hypothetical protein